MLSATTVTDPVIQCPYNRSHLIATSRIQKHIIKCEKNYPPEYKVICPYNATHRLFKSEISDHIFSCSSKTSVDQDLYNRPKQHGFLHFDLCSDITSTLDTDENWDLDSNSDSQDFTVDRCTIPVTRKDTLLDDKNMEGMEIRAPRGYSEAMMKDVDEGSCIDDTESIVSGMAAGRGKAFAGNQMLKLIGKGRGKPIL